MIKGNKGEWSEIYVLIYLLATQKLYAADEHGRKLTNVYYPILKILRDENIGKITYKIADDTEIEIYVNGICKKKLPANVFYTKANLLLREIRHGDDRAFSIEAIEEFMHSIMTKRLAAPSSDKTDITMQVHDINTGFDPIMGFSIKSELGNPPTLLNASGATNFIYTLSKFTDRDMDLVNSIDGRTKILDRIDYIYEQGTSLKYLRTSNDTFSGNLMLIDSRMEEIIATMLIYFYRRNISSCKKLLELIEKENPLQFPQKGFYEFKFKKLLSAIALGMKPSTPWNGIDEANGGYILVTENGNVLAYHIYNRNFFEQYLLDNTRLERGSTSRHDYAYVYKLNEQYRIRLNLQIRFN